MSQLEMARPAGGCFAGGGFRGHSLRIGRRDQSQLAVEDRHEFLEVRRLVGVSGGQPQLLLRSHVTLDVTAGFGKERLQHAPRGDLVQSPLRGSGRAREGLLQKSHAHALGAANLIERRGVPRPVFHHFGKEREPNGDDLPVVRQAVERLGQEGLLLRTGGISAR